MESFNPNGLNEKDQEVSKIMVNVWYRFVTSETPTIDGTDNGTVWPKFTSIDSSLFQIDSNHPSIIKNPFVESYTFISELPIGPGLEKFISRKNLNKKVDL